MKRNLLISLSSAVGAILCLLPGVVSGANLDWTAGDADWQDTANWLSNEDPAQMRLPAAGDSVLVDNGGTARISAATGRVPASGTLSQIRPRGSGGKVIQTGSTVDVTSMWIGNSGGGTYQIDDGTLEMTTVSNGQIDISSINSGNQVGHFIQNGGTAKAGSLRMNYKGTGEAYLELHDGDLTILGNVRMGYDLSGTVTSLFTQTGGTSTIGGPIRMGKKAGVDASDPGSAIVSLEGGEMTITGATPFEFMQPGNPVYVDFKGGVLNLAGTWDFAKLTAIANSDFRVEGNPAVAGSLNFEAVTINSAPYTQISTDGEPPRVITDILYEAGSELVTLVLQTQPGRTYGLYWTPDLENYFMMAGIVSAHPSDPETTVGPFPNPVPGSDQLYFRFGDPDTEDPILVGANGDGQQVTVEFSEAMNPGGALDPANYALQETAGAAMTIASVNPGPVPGKLVLTTATALTQGANYTLTVNNVTDTAGRPVAPGSQTTFIAYDPTGTVEVYILAGQSNMEGQAALSLLEYQADNEPNIARFAHLKDPAGDWIVRDDVWVKFLSKHGKLTPGFGAGSLGAHFGPELEFGLTVAENSSSPVLLIKAAWGGKTLYRDFRPPSSGDNPEGVEAGDGFYYDETLKEVSSTLANLGTLFPDYQDQGYEIRGFAWFQGFNDQLSDSATAEYEANMVNFINDMRADLGVPNMPFVIGQFGVNGTGAAGRAAELKDAQAAAAARSEFHTPYDTVALVPTDVYWDVEAQAVYDLPWNRDAETIALWQTVGSDRPYHYLGSAKTFSDVGTALGEAMIDLLEAAP